MAEEAVISIGEMIKSYGSDYFEGTATQSKSCDWVYAMPLILYQCYKSGINPGNRCDFNYGGCNDSCNSAADTWGYNNAA